MFSSTGEPSAPILEFKVQNRGNSVKVNWIKQDDGGSPIKHYLVRYKAVSILGKEVTWCHFAAFFNSCNGFIEVLKSEHNSQKVQSAVFTN